jgi:chromosome segregation ATPase
MQDQTIEKNKLNEEIIKQTRKIVNFQNDLAQKEAELTDQTKSAENKEEIIAHLELKCRQLQSSHSLELKTLQGQFDQFKKKAFVKREIYF